MAGALLALVLLAAAELSALCAWAAELPAAFVSTDAFSSPDTGERMVATHDALGLTYASIDQGRGTAQMIGNAAAGEVPMLVGRGVVHFIGTTPSGDKRSPRSICFLPTDGLFYAVHSRHVGSADAPMVSQLLGSCEARWP